ncbi:tail fiber domain-containing protein [Bacillus gaemokensis]|uniref:Peptidase S74 domain-containing protein n=1 Tax=Bacillus gaemokensis TaxID=574375 RepID=A0A073KBM4_9BACI|nr:tail fiber domain-containing protein [Bacillus gaemokensis]KEK23945.1 hypothetical protein BAGA_05875 [Bacillus gaemokensis]KYG38066.1 hypothetical protein AZF08_20115 [Bacillus gaemokensis]
MARVIRYLEDGVWKYASVKSVGDLEKLLTASKTDIVSAINELIANGNALEADVDNRFDGIEGTQNELVTITGNVQTELGKVQGDLLDKVEKMYVDEQVNKLVDKEAYEANYQKLEGELLDKVNIDKYNEEYQLVTGRLNDKADLSAFEGVKGRVETVETEITNVKGELGSKITKTEFDGAVGLNRWVARKYDINIGSAGAIPSFNHIKGKQPSVIIDYDDNSIIKPFTGDYYIGHYFTNVYMKVAKTVTLNVTNDDGAVIYMNGAKMYERTTSSTGLSVPLTFRAGWNTVEILHYEHSGAVEQVSLGVKLSSQVDKLTSVIGVGDKNETRLVEAETQIKQNADAILLKAESTTVTNMGNKVTANEGSINVMKDEIKLLVKTEDFNKYTGRLEVAESTIIQHSDQINQKVEKTEYNALNDIVNEQQTSINQLTDEIDLKATKSEYDGLNGRVADAETQINLNTEAINLRAKQTELDKTNGRLQTAESQLTVQANQISTKVTQEDVNKSIDDVALGGSNMLNRSSQKLSALNGKDTTVNFSVSDKLKEFVGKQITISYSIKATNLASNGTASYWIGFEVEITHTDNSKSYLSIRNNVVQEGTYDWTRLAKTHTVANKPIASAKAYATARAFTGSVEIKDIMLEAGNKASQHNISPEDSIEVESRVSNAETEIIQQAEEISLKANSNDVYKKTEADGKVSTAVTQAKSEIKLETDKISQNVTNLTNTVTSQGNTISSHNTSITQMKDSINLKAEAENVYTKIEADGKISNAVTQAKSEIKIETDKITQTVTNMQGNLDDLEDTVVAQGTQIQQTSDEVAINVVKKGNVMASLNASQEGIKILGEHLDITSLVTFNSLDSSMKDKVNAGTDAKNKIDGLNISSRNLILDSGTDYSTTGYLVSTYTLSEDWIAGQEYTFVIKGTISAGQQFGVWMNGSANRVGYATETYVDGVTYVTFKALATTAGNERKLSLYNYPQNTTSATVDWVALYKGNKPLDHSPAPEDMDKRINEFSVRNRNHVLNSTFALGNTGWEGITNLTTTKIVDVTGLEGFGILKGLQVTSPSAFIIQNLALEPFEKAKGYASAFINVKTLVTPKENPRVYMRFIYDQNGTDKTFYAIGEQATVTNGKWVRVFVKFDTTGYTGTLKEARITLATNGATTVDATFAGSLVNFGDVLADWSNAKEDIDKMVSDTDKKAQDVTNRVDDMSSDSKLTPVEKVQLKKEWATMVSEKPSYEALANSYAVATEKTDYINAYNALNTALNGTNGYLKDMQVTSAINGTTFRGVFDDYYDKKSKLIRKVNETSKSIGDSANNKIDGMVIGGNQLVSGTEFLSASGWSRWGAYGKVGAYGIIAPIGRSLYVETKDDAGAQLAVPKGATVGLQGNGRKFSVKKGQEYTLSMNVATSELGDILDYMYLMYTVEGGNRRLGDIKVTDFPQVAPVYTGATVYYYKVKLTFKADRDDDNAYILIAGATKRDLTGSNGYAWIRVNNLKIEEGNVATSWGLSQGDIDQIISDVDKKAEESKKAIADMSNDNKVTPVEKFQLKKEWATITAEKPQYESLSTTYGITTEKTNYVNAYNALNTAVTPIISNMTTTSDINGATFRSTFDDYYDKKAQLIKKINETARILANDADKKAQESKNAIADMANDSKLTPIEKQQLKKEWATISAEKPQYEALSTTYGVTTEKTNYVNAYNALNTFISPFLTNTTVTSDINGTTFRNTFDDYYDKKAQLIKKINELSRTIGTNADTKAQEAKSAIADMSSDSKITPVEKVQLKKEWATMVAEKPQYEALATTYGITTEKTNYVNAYNTLNTALNGTGGILTNMTTTSTVVGATFRAQFDDYYDRLAQLIKKINETAKSLANNAQNKIDSVTTTESNVTVIDGGKIKTDSVTARQININNLFADSAFIAKFKAMEIDASKITTGELRGIYVRTDGTNSFSYMSGGSIASKSKVDSTETWIDEGIIRVRNGVYQNTITPDYLSISALGKSGYGKISYYSHATDLAQNNLNVWSVGKITLEPNGGDLILKGRPHIQKTDANGVALDFPNAGSVKFDQYGNILTGSSAGSEATWSIKDADGQVRLLVPVGKGTRGVMELKAPYGGLDLFWQGYRFMSFWGDSVNRFIRFGDGGSIKWQHNVGRFEFRNFADTDWAHLAGIWDTVSSRDYKKDIDKFDGSALDIINSATPKQYRYTSQSEDERVSIGLIAEEAPFLVQGADKKTVDNYGMTTLAWKAIQELSEQVRYLKNQLNNR